MSTITTIVHFQIPPAHVEEFLTFWKTSIRDSVSRQPGLIGGVFHRGTDADGPYQFINVARWESAAHLEAALQATAEELQAAGVDGREVLRTLGVTVSQNNYVEEVRYAPLAS